MERSNTWKLMDKPLLVVYLILVIMGWFNIYSAAYDPEVGNAFDMSQRYGKQLVFIGVAFLLGLVVLILDIRVFTQFAYAYYALTIFLLILVLLIGKEAGGAKSWIALGGLSLQPSEFAKVTTCLAFAKYASSPSVNLKYIRNQFSSALFFLLPILLIMLQPDAGSAMVYASFLLVMYREGMSGNVLLFGSLAVLLFVLALLINTYVLLGIVTVIAFIFYFLGKKNLKNLFKAILVIGVAAACIFGVELAFEQLKPHQQARINVLLGKSVDPHGVGYNVNQSKIAIGSGGLFGKGYLEGTQTKFNFVPEQSTDFIFCTIGEEWGWVGSMVVLGLFLYMICRIIRLAERQKNDWVRIFGYGTASILFAHILINVGMAIGLFPVIGIPLPFFSYGGSSLWSFTLLLFIFMKGATLRNQY